MKKIIKFLLVLSLFFVFAGSVRAVDLTVTCDKNGCTSSPDGALFSEDNLYPGKEITKIVRAENDYSEARDFAVEMVKLISSDELEKIMTIEIKDLTDNSLVYSSNVIANFANTYNLLSSINSSASKNYQFTVSIPFWVGNDYQDKDLSFDLNLGFEALVVDGDGGNGVSPNPTPTGCIDLMPGEIDDLGASAGTNTVTLSWPAPTNVDNYSIRYGITSGTYLYGATNIGNVTSYVVSGLSANTAYYFQVVPINGCQSGNWSNEVNATPTGTVFGVTTEGNPPPAEGFEEGEVQGKQTEPGQIEGGEQTVKQEVRGETVSQKNCYWWLVFGLLGLAINTIYVYLNKKNLKQEKRRWIVPAVISLLIFGGDKLAHNWWTPSNYCPYMWGISLLTFILPLISFLSGLFDSEPSSE